MKTAAPLTAAETLLQELLQRYGQTACDTPNMFETLMRKHGRACPKEIDILSAALRCGVVKDLRGKTPSSAAGLARVLSVGNRVAPPEAEWAVNAWATALAAAPATVVGSPNAEADAERFGTSSLFRATLVLAAAAATGAIAYQVFGR
jgi:hypothetical protein